jgi:hypothetical protein
LLTAAIAVDSNIEYIVLEIKKDGLRESEQANARKRAIPKHFIYRNSTYYGWKHRL